MKALVSGASGLLGRAVVEKLKQDGHEVTGIGLTRSTSEIVKLDLTDFDAVDAFLDSTKPDVFIHTAAERRPDVVENSPESSHVLNVDVPKHIAQWCKSQGEACPLLINISTDYVFDGVSPPFDVNDPPNPLNAYGMSKWEGERGVQEIGKTGKVTSLRVPVLYGRTESNAESAVNILLDALTNNSTSKPKKMDANAVRYPTCVSDVAKALALLCNRYINSQDAIPPILHFSAMEAMTKYDMCLVMARSLRAAGEEAETDHLEPEYKVDPSAATTRPRHCKLDLSVIKSIGVDVECVSFEAWWREYLQEYAEQARAKREREAEEAALAAAEEKRKLEEQRKREEEERLEKERELEEERIKEQERLAAEEEERQKEERAREKERQEREEQERKEQEREEQEREEQEKKRKEEQEERDRQREAEKATIDEVEINGDRTEAERGEESAREVQEEEWPQEGSTAENEQRFPSLGEKDQDDARKTSSVYHRPSSVKQGPPSNEPNSPNPSFSSLRARPTPPATSERSSPSPSITSSHAVPIPSARRESEEIGEEQTVASTSTSLTETGAEIDNQGIDPLISQEQARLASATKSNNTDKVEEPGFFPAALATASEASLLGIDFAAANSRSKAAQSSGDADSDGYGHPSPRNAPASAPFSAGYGEVQYGLSSDADVSQDAATLKGDAVPTKETDLDPRKDVETKAANFVIRVGDPQKIGDPMTAHIVYTVRIKTDSPAFKASQFSVLRRYSDFRWLHAALVHNNPGIFIPPVPEKVKIGRFAPDLVEARRHGLETCINKIANNVRLQDNEDLKLFLESDQFQADVKSRDQVKGPVPTPEQKTYFGWSTSLTGSTYKYYEKDEWFDEQKVYLDHLETQLKNLVRVISNLSQQRKDMAASISDFSHSIMMLSGSSLSRSLSTCFAGLGEVQRRTFELADLQADADIRDFASVIYEYERMVGSARKAFSTRIDAWQTWQKYEDESKKVKLKHEKLKKESQGNHRVHDGRLISILDEIATIDTRCLNQKREFDLIGLRCKDEMNRFEWDRISGFEEACQIWLQGMIERNEELLAEWEQYAALLERQTGEKVAVE